MDQKYYPYGETEIEYLKKKDKKLAVVIELLGHPERPLDDDLFLAIVHSIVGQQISTKAAATIWGRMQENLGEITPESIVCAGTDQLQSFGMTFIKAQNIVSFAEKIADREFDLDAIYSMTDKEAIEALSSLKGIGVWTAEMILLHCLKRPDIVSYGDLAILRGMRMVYRHRKIDRKLFEKYRKRYSPYGSVASIYLWKVSSGAIEGLTDPAPKKKGK